MSFWIMGGYMLALIGYSLFRRKIGKPLGHYRWDYPLLYVVTGVMVSYAVVSFAFWLTSEA